MVACGLIAVAIATDVVLKMVARQMLPVGEHFAWGTRAGWVGFMPSTNEVLAFSLPIPNAVIWPVGVAVVIALIVHAVRRRMATGRFDVLLLAVILGAISNLTERIALGGVTDYLSVTSMFPAFNIADLLIIGGVIGWWFASYFQACNDPRRGV